MWLPEEFSDPDYKDYFALRASRDFEDGASEQAIRPATCWGPWLPGARACFMRLALPCRCRRYQQPHWADWWNECQDAQDLRHPNAVIAALQLYR